MDDNLGTEIGRGGFGTVYAHRRDNSLCIKVSHKENKSVNSCRQWSNEFRKIRQIVSSISDLPLYKALKMVCLLTPTEFIETSNSCFMVMPRIYRPDHDFTKPTIQAQCGWPSSRIVHKGRGEYIGVKEILEFVSEKDFARACYELGVLMGLIHFKAQNDAYDVEVFLGKESHTRKPRFYIADFDQSSKISSYYDKQSLERMTWSFDAVPYFPRNSCDPTMFDLFKQGYLKASNNSIEIVEKILEDYD